MKDRATSVDERIEAILHKYREALLNDREFSVLKQIREELKELLDAKKPSMENDLPPEKS